MFISIWAFFGLTLFIDLVTLMGFAIITRKNKKSDLYSIPEEEVSVVIPVHKEKRRDLKKTISSLYEEDYPLKKVIIVGDSDSRKLKRVVENLQKKYYNLVYYRSEDKSKAKKINNVVNNFFDIGDFVYVRDCKVLGSKECIRRMMAHFTNERIAAVTSFGRLTSPKGFLSKVYFHGKNWINDIGRFRKRAQEIRNAIFVVCGASTIYRTEVLREVPVPYNTKTEDTHYTWVLQLKGYHVKVANDAEVNAPDVDGNYFSGIKNQIKQGYRWYSGTIQCVYSEGRNLTRNKKLCYTTIVPGMIEALMYSVPLMLLPLLFYINIYWAIGFLIGDTVFSLVSTLIVMPKKFASTVFHYPQIFIFKYLGATIFVFSVLIMTFQKITRQSAKWSNEWTPLSTAKNRRKRRRKSQISIKKETPLFKKFKNLRVSRRLEPVVPQIKV